MRRMLTGVLAAAFDGLACAARDSRGRRAQLGHAVARLRMRASAAAFATWARATRLGARTRLARRAQGELARQGAAAQHELSRQGAAAQQEAAVLRARVTELHAQLQEANGSVAGRDAVARQRAEYDTARHLAEREDWLRASAVAMRRESEVRAQLGHSRQEQLAVARELEEVRAQLLEQRRAWSEDVALHQKERRAREASVAQAQAELKRRVGAARDETRREAAAQRQSAASRLEQAEGKLRKMAAWKASFAQRVVSDLVDEAGAFMLRVSREAEAGAWGVGGEEPRQAYRWLRKQPDRPHTVPTGGVAAKLPPGPAVSAVRSRIDELTLRLHALAARCAAGETVGAARAQLACTQDAPRSTPRAVAQQWLPPVSTSPTQSLPDSSQSTFNFLAQVSVGTA